MTTAGTNAERLAEGFLVAQGLALVERNYRCRLGEIDLVMRDRETLVFVEVRLRSHSEFGGAAGSITRAKQDRLLRAARHYLSREGGAPVCRFDAVLLDGGKEPRIEWIRDAFGE